MLGFDILQMPSYEINRYIKWLKSIILQCEIRIDELEKLKNSRESAHKYKKAINSLAYKMYSENKEFMDIANRTQRIDIIMNRLNCNKKKAIEVHDMLAKWVNKKRRSDRDKYIVLLAGSGMKKTAISKKYGISRQQVHNILDKHKNNFFLKQDF